MKITAKGVLLLLLLVLALPLQAAPNFPALNGRVVDQAGVLSSKTKNNLTDILAQHEKATSNQVVVVTLSSLQGYTIEDFGYQLGRHWKIGQKGKDNGVLLIVAPRERKVRIEVGYGLEWSLTDALSKEIIETEITPRFKKGDMEGGISEGISAILSAIEGSYTPSKDMSQKVSAWIVCIFGLIYAFNAIFIERDREFIGIVAVIASGLTGAWLFSLLVGGIIAVVVLLLFFIFDLGPNSSTSGSSGSSYSSSGSGFGGGGSFGGGGASGGW